MRSVKVLLRENVKDLGQIGDIVDVAPGYAHNYLLPRRIAVDATDDNIRSVERHRERYQAEIAAQEAEINAKVEALGRVKLKTTGKADDTGSLYGSVNASAIAKLMTEAGYPLEEKQVRIDEPIKSVGTHEVPIHVHGDHYVGVQLVVEAEA